MPDETLWGPVPRDRDEMIDFLKNHFRYHKPGSYACNVKVHYIPGLSVAERDACYALLDGDLQVNPWDASGYNTVLEEFARSYHYAWQIGTYGAGGGYLVLIKGTREPSKYRTRCEDCDQLNYSDEAKTCGYCGSEAMVPYQGFDIRSYPYRSVDGEKDWEDWDDERLDDRMDLVLDFDRACDEAVKRFVAYATEHQVVEKTIMVPKTIKVVRPRRMGHTSCP